MGKNKKSRWLCILPVLLLVIGLLAGCRNTGTGTTQENASALQTVTESVQLTDEKPEDTGPGDAVTEAELTEVSPPGTDLSEADNPETELTEAGPPETEQTQPETSQTETVEDQPTIDRDGSYTTKEDVALYIHIYGKLPSNFITKKQAEKLGWTGGSLEPYAPGKCIGGNYFGNYEGLLPDGNYRECDIDTLGRKSRGKKRLIYSDDGRIYYTGDHYESFTQLY